MIFKFKGKNQLAFLQTLISHLKSQKKKKKGNPTTSFYPATLNTYRFLKYLQKKKKKKGIFLNFFPFSLHLKMKSNRQKQRNKTNSCKKRKTCNRGNKQRLREAAFRRNLDIFKPKKIKPLSTQL